MNWIIKFVKSNYSFERITIAFIWRNINWNQVYLRHFNQPRGYVEAIRYWIEATGYEMETMVVCIWKKYIKASTELTRGGWNNFRGVDKTPKGAQFWIKHSVFLSDISVTDYK